MSIYGFQWTICNLLGVHENLQLERLNVMHVTRPLKHLAAMAGYTLQRIIL